MTRADVGRGNYQSGEPPASRRFPCNVLRMTPRRIARMARLSYVAILVGLAVLFLSGCGGSAEAAKAPTGASGGRFGPSHATSRSPAFASDDHAGVLAEPAAEAPAPPKTGNEMGAPGPATTPAAAPKAQPPGEKKPEVSKDGTRAEGTEAPHETSMLIYTARVTMAVYQVEQGLAAVEKIARDSGGYLASRRDREIVIRVPRARFDITLIQIDKIGDVLHRDVQAQDVTDEFVDTEIRIKNARAMQVRLKVLLDKANVKEALEIEKEMRRVTEELELLEGRLKLLKDKIAYSTITVAFEPRGSTIQATRIKLPFPWLTQLGLPTLLQLSEDR